MAAPALGRGQIGVRVSWRRTLGSARNNRADVKHYEVDGGEHGHEHSTEFGRPEPTAESQPGVKGRAKVPAGPADGQRLNSRLGCAPTMPPNPTTPDFSGCLPDRPIAVRPPPTSRAVGDLRFVTLFAVLAGVLGGSAPISCTTGGSTRVVEAADARIGETHCVTRSGAVGCAMWPSWTRAARSARTRTLWYLFIDTVGAEPIALLRSTSEARGDHDQPGIAKFYHRPLALALIVAVVVSASRVGPTGAHGHRARGARSSGACSGQRAVPVVVGGRGQDPHRLKGRRWTYTTTPAAGTSAPSSSSRARTDPLFVTRDGK